MQFTLQIPDDIGHKLAQAGDDLPRRALEAFAIEELKAGRISEAELGRMLGLARIQIDSFLKTHRVYQDITLQDVDRDVADLNSLGL